MKTRKNVSPNIMDEEFGIMNHVYSHLESEIKSAAKNEDSARSYVDSGAYEDQDAFMAHAEYGSKKNVTNQARRLLYSLKERPYFAHMKVRYEGDTTFEMLLSENQDLDELKDIGENHFLVPFKADAKAPIIPELRKKYLDLKVAGVRGTPLMTVNARGVEQRYNAEIVREVQINRKTLDSVTQYYPTVQSEGYFDDLLSRRLRDNRTNAKLNNIIATIQQNQYEIVASPADTSFVVQGCAGSGKSQCLIHRLFFLRDTLQDTGWQQVLFITPTQLFLNYSRDLMRRYRLADIRNSSLAAFYKTLLEAFDQRFRNRQYLFELTEEYLPDGYLNRVYDPKQIDAIGEEIGSAIATHIGEAYRLLDLGDMPSKVDSELVETLVRKLDRAIEEYDRKSAELSAAAEYKDAMTELSDTEKQLQHFQNRIAALREAMTKSEEEERQFRKLTEELKAAKEELAAWQNETEHKKKAALREYQNSIRAYESEETDADSRRERYRTALARYADISMPFGRIYNDDLETKETLEGLVKLAKDDIEAFTKGAGEKEWTRRTARKKAEHVTAQEAINNSIAALSDKIEQLRKRIAELFDAVESVDKLKPEHRASMERSRYYLSRIESSVFEQEVWNKLQPLKMEFGIESIRVTQEDDGRRKQTRILYKSDLLFYLMIYSRLHSIKKLPPLRLICIDEAQDLHRADFSMLRELYPKAAFNVFGDTAQGLHESCGVTDWKTDTGIDLYYELNTNYRNSAAIVDFCRHKFNSGMESYGQPEGPSDKVDMIASDKINSILSGSDPAPVIIVKNRDSFAELMKETGLNGDRFEFIDTKALQEEDGKIHCYTVFAAKGLEFPDVIVFARDMTRNQKIVASTRAMRKLYYCE